MTSSANNNSIGRKGSDSETAVADLSDAVEWVESDDPSESHYPIEIGTVIRERFELQSVIGGGSTAVVYRALDRLHLETDDRDPYVAIKVLRQEFLQHSNALATLQREVRKAQTLAHENIISVYSFEREGSLVYMTMELLDGKPLRDIIAESHGGVPADRAVPMIHSMARALAYAHENEIVHSDFSPGNVFLTGRGQIKVLDFGVARGAPKLPVNSSDGERPYFDGARGMTPAYASPQMLEGLDPDPSDDVFALAIVAYELLTGRHPFNLKPVNKSGFHIPDIHSLPGLTRAQKQALARAFAPERESRFASAMEFLEAFARARSTRTVVQLGITAAAAIGVIAIAAFRNGELQPDVPFENLPVTQQQRFNEAISEGNIALGFGDAGLPDAFAYFSDAYDLHRNNERALRGLEQVADAYLGTIRTMDVDTQRDVFELLYCQDYLATYEPATESCSDLLGEECEAIARECSVRSTN